jgi:hypothetical protein
MVVGAGWTTKKATNCASAAMSALGQKQTFAAQKAMSAMGQKQTHAPQRTSRRPYPVVSFVYLSAERLFNKFYGINCRP